MLKQIVYIRSKSKRENRDALSIWRQIYSSESFTESKLWLITNGNRLTNDFYNKYKQGCAFHIIDEVKNPEIRSKWSWTHNSQHNLEYTNGIKGKTYIFSQLSYEMLMEEYIINNYPTNRRIEYYMDNNIIYDLPEDFLERNHNCTTDEQFKLLKYNWFGNEDKYGAYRFYIKLKGNNKNVKFLFSTTEFDGYLDIQGDKYIKITTLSTNSPAYVGSYNDALKEVFNVVEQYESC